MYLLNFLSNLLLYFPFRREVCSFVKMYCWCILKLRECHHINQFSWQGSLFCVWEGTGSKCSFWSVPWHRYDFLLPFSPYLFGWFISECTWLGSLVVFSFINLLSGRCGSGHTEGPGSAAKLREGLDRLTSCSVLLKAVLVLALKIPRPGKLLCPRLREIVGHPGTGTWDIKLWPFMLMLVSGQC